MSLKEFSKNDVFRSSLVTYPRYEFRVFNGTISSKNYVDGILKFNDLIVDDYVVTIVGSLLFNEEQNSGLIAVI